MRAHIFAHQLYLFGGVAFGFAIGALSKAPLGGLALLLVLLASVGTISVGFLMLRKAKRQLTQQSKTAAIEQMAVKATPDQSKESSDAVQS